jgi:hypothetical protein
MRTRASNLDAGRRRDLQRRGAVLERREIECVVARQPEGCGRLAVGELQRQHPHADEVGAVDTLVGLRKDEADAEQIRTFGRPVARGARSIFLLPAVTALIDACLEPDPPARPSLDGALRTLDAQS